MQNLFSLRNTLVCSLIILPASLLGMFMMNNEAFASPAIRERRLKDYIVETIANCKREAYSAQKSKLRACLQESLATTLKNHAPLEQSRPEAMFSEPPQLLPFDIACKKQTSITIAPCDSGKVFVILKKRAETPSFVHYTDSDTGVSFYYPSSIAYVDEDENDPEVISVPPINPGVGGEYPWGTIINVAQCGEKCPENLPRYIKLLNPETKILSTDFSQGEHKWVKSVVNNGFGFSYLLYATIDQGKLITVNNFVPSDPNIAAAFNKILETISW